MSNDQKIREYRQAVEAKRAALGVRPKLAYTTNALLDLGDGKRTNLNTLASEEECVFFAGQILVAVDVASKANEALGTNVVPKFGKYTAEQWINDIKQRADLIVWENKKKQLGKMDEKLAALRSVDAQTEDAIADIAAELAE